MATFPNKSARLAHLYVAEISCHHEHWEDVVGVHQSEVFEPQDALRGKADFSALAKWRVVGEEASHVTDCDGEGDPEGNLDPWHQEKLVRTAAFFSEQLASYFFGLYITVTSSY